MTTLLSKLSKKEFKIINQVKILNGTVESIEIELEQLEIPKMYEEIYGEYISYYKSTTNLETLKRIIFIQWYGASEPLAFTGIGELNNHLQLGNLKSLKKLIEDQSLDDEFNVMINHYYSVSNWYFDSYLDFSKLIKSLTKQTLLDFNTIFNNRGQMGEYWNSLRKQL